jgi:hypothetical protein
MARLCERPGCAEPAAVAFGFDPARQLVWLAALDAVSTTSAGALCRRHADAMVVPRGWWLDDQRVQVPTLFRPGDDPEPVVAADPGAEAPTPPAKPKRRRADRPKVEQPPLASGEEGAVPAWVPVFDGSDDLGGLLRATTPLLARAFGNDAAREASRHH